MDNFEQTEAMEVGQPIRSLQHMLNQLAIHNPAFLRLAVDGIFGERTLEAVMIFQRDSDLPVTGVVDNATWDAIVAAYVRIDFLYGPPPPLNVLPSGSFTAARGKGGAPVMIVQAMFNALSKVTENFDTCEVNDINDGSTYQNLCTIQQLSGLPVTGTLDRPTWVFLSQLYHALVTRG